MDLGISGKVAMVAAASKGIGLATAKALAAEGCRVSICGRTESTLEEAASQIDPETRTYVVDVANGEDLSWWHEQTVGDLGPVDILVTNTGGPPAGSVWDLTEEQWKSGIDSTLMSVIRLTNLVVPHMRARGWGRVVHITSLVAKQPNLLLPISATLRTGLMSLTKVQALELAAEGITVNGVLPGHTLTDRQVHLAEIRAEREGLSLDVALEKQGSELPIRRLAQPEEIADVIAFLCSSRASYLTGQSIAVEGGAITSVL